MLPKYQAYHESMTHVTPSLKLTCATTHFLPYIWPKKIVLNFWTTPHKALETSVSNNVQLQFGLEGEKN